jgi:hypothetical protein
MRERWRTEMLREMVWPLQWLRARWSVLPERGIVGCAIGQRGRDAVVETPAVDAVERH